MDNTILFYLIAVAIAIVVIIPVYISKTKKKQGNNKINGEDNTQISGDYNSTNVTHIGTQNVYSSPEVNTPVADIKSLSPEDVKARIKILFVDDKDDFQIISMLRNNGYQVEYLDDIIDFDDKSVKYADIIFLDINGVGVAMKFKNQGMGLCGALRDYYGTSKKLILYSGETEGSIFDKDAKKADATLPKDSDLYQFISYITQYGKELLEKAG